MTDSLLFAAVADDDTGASDLAGMFADQGVRALLVLDAGFLEEADPVLDRAQAIVLATATRALPPQRAFATTFDAVRRAASLRPRLLQIKYCSTFDSTEEGNIGPSLDAALEALGESFTIAVPALPVNGRTTYLGYHFVNGRLLSESPMRHHPLTPMTNPNLVDHLQKQTARRVGLTPYPAVAAGAASLLRHWEQLRADGCGIAVVDCLDDAQAAAIAEAACELKLVSGSSVFGMHLPSAWRNLGWWKPPAGALWERLAFEPGRGKLVVAGSCSAATAAQNSWLERTGADVLELDPRKLLEVSCPEVAGRAAGALTAGRTVLLKLRSDLGSVEETQGWGAARGWSPSELGLRLSAALASLTRAVLDQQAPEVLVCAGGETAGAVCRALGIRAFAVGRNIQPGVPLCFPLQSRCVPMVLKSGNFGTQDFYGAAFAAAGRLRGALGGSDEAAPG